MCESRNEHDVKTGSAQKDDREPFAGMNPTRFSHPRCATWDFPTLLRTTLDWRMRSLHHNNTQSSLPDLATQTVAVASALGKRIVLPTRAKETHAKARQLTCRVEVPHHIPPSWCLGLLHGVAWENITWLLSFRTERAVRTSPVTHAHSAPLPSHSPPTLSGTTWRVTGCHRLRQSVHGGIRSHLGSAVCALWLSALLSVATAWHSPSVDEVRFAMVRDLAGCACR